MPSKTEVLTFFKAVHDGNVALVESLLNQGAQEGIMDVFFWAAKKGNENLVRYCVEDRHIDINIINKRGETALFGAAFITNSI